MRDSRDFKKAVLLVRALGGTRAAVDSVLSDAQCQTFVTSFYLTVGVVVYYYAGQYVASPALGTAGPLLKRISYGFSLPGLLCVSLLSLLSGNFVLMSQLCSFTSVFYTHVSPSKS